MSNLVTSTRKAGWAGLGLWHHAVIMTPAPGGGTGYAALGQQLAALSKAGVQHIKVDGTDLAGVVTSVARNSTNGKLRVEHKRSPGAPLNGNIGGTGRAPQDYITNLLSLTEV